MALTQVTLSGTIRNADTSVAQGQIAFELSGDLFDPVSGIVVDSAPVIVNITNGVYSVTLYATDSAGVTPPGLVYKITRTLIVAGVPVRSIGFAPLPSSLAGASAGLDDLVYTTTGSGLDLASHISDATLHGTGRELGYAEVTTSMALGGTTPTDIPGLTCSVVCTGKPISIEWGGFVYASVDAYTIFLDLYEDNVMVGRGGETRQNAGGLGYSLGHRRRTPSAGAHIYKVKLNPLTGTGTANALATATYPLELTVIEHP